MESEGSVEHSDELTRFEAELIRCLHPLQLRPRLLLDPLARIALRRHRVVDGAFGHGELLDELLDLPHERRLLVLKARLQAE